MADSSAPFIQSLFVHDPIVDRNTGDNSVRVSIVADDAESDVTQVKLTFAGPEGASISKTLNGDSGDLTFTLGGDLPDGDYHIYEATVTDSSGSSITYSARELAEGFKSGVFLKNSTPDSTKPELINFEVLTPTLDYSQDDPRIEIRITVSDDESGIKYTGVFIDKPDGTSLEFSYHTDEIQDGDTWTHTLVIDPGELSNGVYQLINYIDDKANNHIEFDTNELHTLGFDHSFEVINSINDDTTPELVSFEILSQEKDPDTGDTIIKAFVEVDDQGGSGFEKLWVFLRSEQLYSTGEQQYNIGREYNKTASQEDGWWPGDPPSGEFIFRIPNHLSNGTYNFEIVIEDQANNEVRLNKPAIEDLGFDGSVVITGNDSDETPPLIQSLTITDAVIDFDRGEQSVTFAVEIDETGSGFSQFSIHLYSAEGYAIDNGNGYIHEHGYQAEGQSTITIDIPEYYTDGPIQIVYSVSDKAQNVVEGVIDSFSLPGVGGQFEIISDGEVVVPAEPPVDDDGNNGHGNDDGGVDDSNPGNSDGSNGNGNGNRPDDDNGHGNDADGVDESNPGNSDGSNGNDNGNRPDDDNGHGNDADGVDESNPGNSDGTNRGGNGNGNGAGRKDDDGKPGKGGQIVRERGEVLEEDDEPVRYINGKQISKGDSKSFGFGIRSSGQDGDAALDDSDLDLIGLTAPLPAALGFDALTMHDMEQETTIPYLIDMDMLA